MFFQIFLRFFRKLKKTRYKRVIIFGVLMMGLGVWGIMYFESGENEGFDSYKDALWWMFVTMTTVGYGDISPVTVWGRIIAVLIMLLGIGFLGMLISVITESLFERRLKEDRGMKPVNAKGHIIVCNWNHKAQELIREFRSDPKMEGKPIVIIADIEHRPVEDENVLFVQGDATSEEVLKRAGVMSADTVIVLSDENVEVNSRDAKAILTVLTIESLRSEVYTCVELLDPENAQHARRAKVDEIIVTGEISSKLLARSALDHGISNVVSELVCGLYGNAFYKIDVPPSLVGKSVEELFLLLKRDHKTILIALEQGDRCITNPDLGITAQEGDRLIVLAERRPRIGAKKNS